MTAVSNGTTGAAEPVTGPKIAEATQKLLDAHQRAQQTGFNIQDEINQLVDALAGTHPDHLDLIVRHLEGAAQRIHRKKIAHDREKHHRGSDAK